MRHKSLFTGLHYRPTKAGTVILTRKYTYKDIEVPKHFETNGADVPRLFWSLVPPFKPEYMPATVLHDYLIKKGDITLANKIYGEVLLKIEDTFKTRTMVRLVKAYWFIKLSLVQASKYFNFL